MNWRLLWRSILDWLVPNQRARSATPAIASVPFDPLIHTHDSNLEVVRCLSSSSGKRARLPPELILQILADPSRWLLQSRYSLPGPTSIDNREGERILVGTPPLNGRDISSMRKFVFSFTSKDQGWSSYLQDKGTYRNSWTWFDVGITHDGQKKLFSDNGDGELHERVYWSQHNKHAWREWESYHIELELGHRIFSDLEEGDAVVLWAKASFPGWTNNVESAAIELWCEDDLGDLNETAIGGGALA